MHDWEGLAYGKVLEALPTDEPELLGKHMVTIIYHEANSCHNVLIGRSVTGVLSLVNETPIDWCSKK